MEFLKKSVKWKEPRQKSSTDFSFNKQTELSANHKYVCYENTLGYVQKKISHLGWETRRKSWTTVMNEFWDLLKVKDLIDIVFALSLTFQRSNSFNPTVFQCSKTARGFSDEEKHLNFFFAAVQTQQKRASKNWE